MSGTPSGSGIPPTKAIGSLAKKQSDVTRQGTQKLKFVPTLPARRKKEEVKPEPVAQEQPVASSSTSERGTGRGRGRGDARGRGRGRGAAPPILEMTASGPFAMGPALVGNTSARRTVPRSNFAPIPMPGSGPSSGTSTPRGPGLVKLEQNVPNKPTSKDDDEVYSEPDEGVEIIDMEDVKQLDWMAPETLRIERAKKPKKEEEASEAVGEVDAGNAIDLDQNEEEEEIEDIIGHFAAKADIEENSQTREESIYLFQFPSPFPRFTASKPTNEPTAEASAETPTSQAATSVKKELTSKTVSSVAKEPEPEEKVEGAIGELLIYKSGIVKMKLGNGILFDVTATTQPSFLQQAVYLDEEGKKLVVLGEVNKRFAVAPDVDALLVAMETKDNAPLDVFEGEGLIAMDTT